MLSETEILQKDKQFIWHPCSQMKDYETYKPLIIKKAFGSYIEDIHGRKIIDAISSWWCKTLGHNHPEIKKRLVDQINEFEHVIFSHTTHACIVDLSEKLTKLTSTLNKIFYAGDGSCAIEIAMKMSLHSRVITGQLQRKKFIALKNGYHGETFGALSMSDLGIYRDPYKSVLLDPYFISPIPYVTSIDDPLWHDCASLWNIIEAQLNPLAKTTTAILFEPIMQGSAGMLIYSQDFLKRLRKWTRDHDIHLIADEIMTGLGRTGKMLACEHAGIEADFLCLSKGLTAGWMPFSAVLTSDPIYDFFYDDYSKGKSFLHSHTHSGNAMAASIALAVLDIIEKENLIPKANDLGKYMFCQFKKVAEETGKLTSIRYIGSVVAGDLVDHPDEKRIGFKVYQKAMQLGALLRPLGNTIYWLPPLNIPFAVIDELKQMTQEAITISYQ